MAVPTSREAPIRVALAGAGMISWYHLVAWRALTPRVRVVAVCDPDPRRAGARAEEFGIPAVHRDAAAMFAAEAIDALDVASPRETHAAWVEAAAAHGIDVLCQKPLTPTLAEAEALVRRVTRDTGPAEVANRYLSAGQESLSISAPTSSLFRSCRVPASSAG
jgi:predicted dehydrogenase